MSLLLGYQMCIRDRKRAKRGYDLTNKDYKIRKRKSKLEFRDAKKELKKTDEYKRASEMCIRDRFKRDFSKYHTSSTISAKGNLQG